MTQNTWGAGESRQPERPRSMMSISRLQISRYPLAHDELVVLHGRPYPDQRRGQALLSLAPSEQKAD